MSVAAVLETASVCAMTATEVMREITSAMVVQAMDDFSAGKVPHGFHPSERYDLLHGEVRYPPKAIIGLAAAHVPGGRLLAPSEFSGGLGSSCFRTLEKLEFSIVRKHASSAPTEFVVGTIYNRKADIHNIFGGQERGGIATPAEYPFIFLFSGERGDDYGYKDEFRESDGVFLYTGEGQIGDMKMQKGNAAILNAGQDGKRILLFKEESKGHVVFQGEVDYLGHGYATRPDRDGNPRTAIIFELGLNPKSKSTGEAVGDPATDIKSLSGKTLQELRALALLSASEKASLKIKTQLTRLRSEAVKKYTLKRANGRCEGCGNEAPFKTKKNQPYLEPHHTTRLADDGPDHPANVIGLCPTCHRRAHHAIDAAMFNAELKDILSRLEPQ
jgi:5-methylcytosine-specific restriction protein A